MAEDALKTETTEKKWINNVATISSALIALGTLLNWFFGKQNSFPHWFFYILTFLIVVILYKYFEETIRRYIQVWALKSYLREAHFHLVDSLQRFSELVTQRSDDSIVRVLETISGRVGQEIVDKDLFAYADQLIANVFLKLSDSGRNITVGEFKGIISDMSTLIKFCTHFYFKKPLHVREVVDLTRDEMKNLELARENFADFVRRYQVFYDEVNAKLGSTARGHFEIPKPLSYGV